MRFRGIQYYTRTDSRKGQGTILPIVPTALFSPDTTTRMKVHKEIMLGSQNAVTVFMLIMVLRLKMMMVVNMVKMIKTVSWSGCAQDVVGVLVANAMAVMMAMQTMVSIMVTR